MPDPRSFPYTFDHLSGVVEGLLAKTGFTHAGFFMQDYGGPVGFRILGRRPEWMEWLILQNTNAYEEGFTAAWDGIRHRLWKNPGPETEAPLLPFLDLEGIKLVYLHGHTESQRISPDNWQMDFRFMERPHARRVQLDLFYDYRTNVALYPTWQQFLRTRQPHTLIFWVSGTSSSRLKVARPTCAISRTRSCIALSPGTSPSKTAVMTSPRTSSAFTPRLLRRPASRAGPREERPRAVM
jgi:pimeloyl-ACP methyl ester carboxylesterase